MRALPIEYLKEISSVVAEAAACCTSGESREAASARLDPAISGCGIVALRVCEQSPQIMPLGHPVDST